MVANPARRAAVTDAALDLLGGSGARALTHRAVDAHAGVPAGTCANYFPKRAGLLVAMAERVFEHLRPDEARLRELAALTTDEALPEYAAYVTERLLRRPALARALIELRLEAARSPDVARELAPVLRDGLGADVQFHEERGLRGGRDAVVLLHHVVNGLVLDHLTVSIDPDQDPVEATREAARRLLGRAAAVSPS